MAYFTCQECTCTFNYTDSSPAEHGPWAHQVVRGPVCKQCFDVLIQALPEVKGSLVIDKAVYATYLAIGGQPGDYVLWLSNWEHDVVQAAVWLQARYPDSWKTEYFRITDKERN